jgi:hypothetical protein
LSKKNNHRLTHKSRTGRVLRAAATIGAATTICCGTYPFTAQAAVTSGPEVEALKQLKMDYVANVDLNNWIALYQQFTPNALIDASDSLPGGLGPVFHGRDQFIAFNALVLGPLSTHHEAYNPLITVADDGKTATGVWQVNDRLSDPFNIIGLRGHGVYTDTYVKNGDTWVESGFTEIYHKQYIEILPGILNLKIYIKDDGTPFPVAGPEAGADANPDVEAIKQLKMDYFANVDLNNWIALYQQFTPNALIDASDSLPGGLGPVFHDRNQFVGFDALVLTAISTHHEGYNPVITVADDGTTATGVWQMNDRLTDPFNIIGLRGHGVYTDSYVKNGDTWLVDKSTLVYHQQYIEILPGILNLKFYIKDDGTPYPVVAPSTTSTTSLVSTHVETAVDAAPAPLTTAPLSRAIPLTLDANDVNDLSTGDAVGADVTSTNSLASKPSGPVDEPSGGETADRGSQPEKTTTATGAGGEIGLTHVTSGDTHDDVIDTEENSTTAVSPSIDAVRKDDSEVRKPVQPATVQAKSTTAHETSGAETNNPTSVGKLTAGSNGESGGDSEGSGNSD